MEQHILDSTYDAIFGLNLAWEINYCNKAACDLLGYSATELIGRNYKEFFEDCENQGFENIVETLIFNESLKPIRTDYINIEKKKRAASIQYSPIKDQNGKISGISSIVRLASQYEKAISKAQALLETAPDAMVIVNKAGEIVLINAQTEKLFGYKKEELLGKEVELLIPDKFLKYHRANRSKYTSKPKTRNMGQGMELYGKKKSGKNFPVEISLSPLETEEGMLVSAAIRDITKRKKVEKELEKYNQQLQNKNKELEQFAYIASHDLQEPLRNVLSFTGLLKENYSTELDEMGLKFMYFITEATTRMSQLIKGLLDYSRIGSNTKLESVDCNVILAMVHDDFDPLIKEINAVIKVSELPKIMGYEVEVKLLFQNLIGNAIKFRDPNRPAEISVSASKEEGDWKFCVSDNGIGISPEYKEKIFIIYQRLHAGKDYEGTGIGLAHCRKIVDLHGGKIWMESELGKGSKFYFTIQEITSA